MFWDVQSRVLYQDVLPHIDQADEGDDKNIAGTNHCGVLEAAHQAE